MPKGVKMRGNELRANTLSWEEHELYRNSLRTKTSFKIFVAVLWH